MRGQIILSHGLDSSPDATKVSQLASQARARGWAAQCLDYRADDAHGMLATVDLRRQRLGAAIAACERPPVLVGSSMGAFVSALASLQQPVAALFLLATPPLIPGHDQPLALRPGVPVRLVHGWRDAICPAHAITAFAESRRLPLLLLDDDHRLGASMADIALQFDNLLNSLENTA